MSRGDRDEVGLSCHAPAPNGNGARLRATSPAPDTPKDTFGLNGCRGDHLAPPHPAWHSRVSWCPGGGGEVHALSVILYLEPDGPPQSPGDVEEPLDDQSSFFLWGSTRVSLFPQSSRAQGSLPTLPTRPQDSAPAHGTHRALRPPQTRPLLPGVLSSFGGRRTNFYVLQGTRPGAERKPEACPSTARAQGLGQGG